MNQAAFSLIETLVALIVVSVGMIGIAALFGQGLSAGRTSLHRSQAVTLAADMAERIRANRSGGAAYSHAPANRGCDPGGGGGCSPLQLAEHDLFVWTAQVARLLPGGVGTVAAAAGNPPTYRVRVAWQETGLTSEEADPSYEVAIRVPTP